jgi:hypothetical protein
LRWCSLETIDIFFIDIADFIKSGKSLWVRNATSREVSDLSTSGVNTLWWTGVCKILHQSANYGSRDLWAYSNNPTAPGWRGFSMLQIRFRWGEVWNLMKPKIQENSGCHCKIKNQYHI